MDFLENLSKELDNAAQLKDPVERSMTIASILAEALRSIGRDPVLVGGAAVEFYTQGGYSTADIDMVAEGGSDLFRVMSALGFERFGKDFKDIKRAIYVEFPGSSLKASERVDTIAVGRRTLRVISIEDLIVDRLNAYKFWRSGIDGLNTLLLLEMGAPNQARLLQRARQEDVADALEAVQRINDEVIRKKLPRKEATRLLKDWIESTKKR
jgi:hypothetical protein